MMSDFITDILNKFDFTKVHAAMTHLDWKWYDSHVPTVSELRREASRLIMAVCDSGEAEYSAQCGGLVAYRSGVEIGLTFELEGVSVEPDREAK
jgi:hypothetical protein